MKNATNPREIIKKRLIEDLGIAEEIDIKTAVICGEIGCTPKEQEYIKTIRN